MLIKFYVILRIESEDFAEERAKQTKQAEPKKMILCICIVVVAIELSNITMNLKDSSLRQHCSAGRFAKGGSKVKRGLMKEKEREGRNPALEIRQKHSRR